MKVRKTHKVKIIEEDRNQKIIMQSDDFKYEKSEENEQILNSNTE